MKYLFTSPARSPSSDRDIETKFLSKSVDLGGYFYDFHRGNAGDIHGVRYYIMERVDFKNHLAWSAFETDPRFIFCPKKNYVDIFFDAAYRASYESGALLFDCAQEFGGISAVVSKSSIELSIQL